MKTCLVNLVSEQTVPNIIVADHFKPDFLLFVTTDDMEKRGKSEAILETLKKRGRDYTEACEKLVVAPNSIIDLQTKVSNWYSQCNEEYQFVVNLTGGTKLMSIAAYDLFTDFGSEMIYVPIPKNEYLIPFPKRRPKEPIKMPERLSVSEYLTAHGVSIQNEAHLQRIKEEASARRELTNFIFANYLAVEGFLKWFWVETNGMNKKALKKGCSFSGKFTRQNPEQETLLDLLGFEKTDDTVSRTIGEQDWRYIRGGWLEERLFLAISETAPAAVDIQLGIYCRDAKGNTNEFDVLYTWENSLFLVECKSLEAKEDAEKDFLYKLGALRRQFGLTPRAYLATTSGKILDSDGKIKPHLLERATQFQTTIIALRKVQDLEGYFRAQFSSN